MATGSLEAVAASATRPARRDCKQRQWAARPLAAVLVVDPDGCRDGGDGGPDDGSDMCPGGVVWQACHDVGARLICCSGGAEGLFQFGRETPDLVLLRARLPDLDAADVVRVVRQHGQVRVLLGVGDGDVDSIGPALLAGASEVVAYPFRRRELTAAVARHVPDAAVRRAEQSVITLGGLEMNGPAFEVRLHGVNVPMPLREFELLRYLVTRHGEVVTHQEIRDAVWAPRGEAPRDTTVTLHVRRLRERLGGSVRLVTVRGVGVRLDVVQCG